MRKTIAAIQISVDGFIEDRAGAVDWVRTWEDLFDLMERVDLCVLGRGMYDGYAHYWRAIVADPTAVLSFAGRAATPGEVAYARFADRTPHMLVSRTLDHTDWANTTVVSDVEAVRTAKTRDGGDIYVVGGATLASTLIELGLVDELKLVVQPLLLGGGKAFFKEVVGRRALALQNVRTLEAGAVRLTYHVTN